MIMTKKKRFPTASLLDAGMKPINTKDGIGTLALVTKKFSDGKFELSFKDGSKYCYNRKQFFLHDPADYKEWFE